MSAPLSAAVIGAGAGGQLSIGALHDSPRFDLRAVVDLRPDVRERVEGEYGIRTFASAEELFAECPTEVVCISTYAPSHLELTRAALAAGSIRGLLVEKPLGESAEAGAQILAAAAAANVPLVVPHGLMAQSSALEIVALVRSGAIGDVSFVEMECTGWDIINAGIHWIQFFVALVEPTPVVTVLTAVDASTRTYRDGLQVETEAMTLARTRDGVRLLLNTGDRVPVSRDETVCLIKIVGSEGWIEYGAFEQHYVILSPAGKKRVDVAPFEVSGHRRHLEHLADQVESGQRDNLVPCTSLQALEIVEAAYESARRTTSVSLPLDGPQPGDGGDWDPGAPYSGSGGGRDGRSL